MIEISEKKQVHPGLFVMECPMCKDWKASASEWEYLPERTNCDCEDLKKKNIKNKK